MPDLKLGPISDEKPVRITTELPASVHRDLVLYTNALATETRRRLEPAQLVAPMLERFMATDRAFAKFRRGRIKRTERPLDDEQQGHEPEPKNA